MTKNSGKDPSIQFYWKDWLSDTRLKRSSKVAKGVWIDLICMSCDMPKPGVFRDENGSLSHQEVVELLSGNTKENKAGFDELLRRNIIKQFDDGTLYVKRVYEDMELRAIRREAGKQGGNPNLVGNLDKQKSKQTTTPSSSSSSSSSSSLSNTISLEDNNNNGIPSSPPPKNHNKFEDISVGFTEQSFTEIVAAWNESPQPKPYIVNGSILAVQKCIVENLHIRQLSVNELILAIGNYRKVLSLPNSMLKHRWNLKDFIESNSGLMKFIEPFDIDRYRKNKQQTSMQASLQRMKDEELRNAKN